MNRFDDFLTKVSTVITEEHKFKKFLQDNDLMDRWKSYKKPKLATYGDARGWEENPDRPVHELKQVIQNTVNNTRMLNNTGIVSIDFEIQHKENVQSGTKLTVELKGVARANGKMQVRRLLEDLMVSAKKPLSEVGYFLQIQLNTLYVAENKNEELDFMVMANAIHTTSK